jgi:hypothetical protein
MALMRIAAPKYLRRLESITRDLACLCAIGAWGIALPASPSALTINACSLLGRDEIAHVIGLPVEPGVRKDDGLVSDGAYSSACVWEVDVDNPNRNDPQAPLGGKSFVILNAQRWPAGSGLAHTFLDSFRQAEVDHTIPGKTSPRNFGDEALWWGDGLAVRKGDVSFGLSVFLPPSDKRPPKGVFEARLAPQILRRLDPHPAAKKKTGQ